MSWFQSIFNGIGTGAGVAWPTFGIIFAVLGGAIGGPISLVLGMISVSLFLGVSVPIFYFSYQATKNSEQELQGLLKKNKSKLAASIEEYILEIKSRYTKEDTSDDVLTYLNKIISNDLCAVAKDSCLYQLLTSIQQNAGLHKSAIVLNELFWNNLSEKYGDSSLSIKKLLLPAFFSFVGTFGSVAGCSAGVAGFLTGVGIFTSFVTMPILGWGIIVGALVMGGVAAYGALLQTKEKNRNNELTHLFKKTNKQLVNMTWQRNFAQRLHHATADLQLSREQRQEFLSKITACSSPSTTFFLKPKKRLHVSKTGSSSSILSISS